MATTARLGALDSSGRSTALLLRRIASVQSNRQLLRDLRHAPWTADRFGLLDLACSSALELVVDGHLTSADWLARQLLAADPDVSRAHEVCALVAVEQHRPVRARRHHARSIRTTAAAPQVHAWLRAEHNRMATRAVFSQLAHGVAGAAGDAVQLWQAAVLSTDAQRRTQLQALAVAEACRPGAGYDAALWQRRYLLERLADRHEVAAIRARLDAELAELATQTNDREPVEAAPLRPAAPWPTGTAEQTAVVLYPTGPRSERDLAAVLAESAAALTAVGTDATLLVLHGGNLDPATISAAVHAAPRVRFVAADERRWAAVGDDATSRMMALDALRLTGYRQVVLAPVTAGVGRSLAAALGDDARATALRNDVVAGTNLVVVDVELTGAGLIAALDASVARELAADGRRDVEGAAPWRALRAVRDGKVLAGTLHVQRGFTGHHVPGAPGADPVDDTDLLALAASLVADGDHVGAAELFARQVRAPHQLTDRVLRQWVHALRQCDRYELATRLSVLCGDR